MSGPGSLGLGPPHSGSHGCCGELQLNNDKTLTSATQSVAYPCRGQKFTLIFDPKSEGFLLIICNLHFGGHIFVLTPGSSRGDIYMPSHI